MRHVRPLRFDALESRKLLTKAHAVPHAAAAAPLVLNGTLLVDNNPNATTQTQNADGSTTTAVVVMGQLGSLGPVSGYWTDTVDAYGDSTGTDVLRLHDAEGSFILAVNTQNASKAYPAGRGAVYHEYSQQLYDGTGAYAGHTETGSVKMTTNRAQTVIMTLELHTKGT